MILSLTGQVEGKAPRLFHTIARLHADEGQRRGGAYRRVRTLARYGPRAESCLFIRVVLCRQNGACGTCACAWGVWGRHLF